MTMFHFSLYPDHLHTRNTQEAPGLVWHVFSRRCVPGVECFETRFIYACIYARYCISDSL